MTEQITIIEYQYADNGNYKAYNTVVLPGALTDEQIQQIWDGANGGEEFLPGQVGLALLQDQVWPDEDEPGHHVWHSLTDITVAAKGSQETEIEPTRTMTATEFADQFLNVVWDDMAENERMESLLGW